MTTPGMPTFAAILKRARRAAGLTQAELAESASLSTEAVSALERGVNRAPRRETVALLADALGMEGTERAQLEQAARRRTSPASAPTLPGGTDEAIPLIGRAREVALIENLLVGSAPPMLLFAGEPGVGKTRLLREAANTAATSGWTVLAGGLQHASTQEPYAPMLDTLERYIATRTQTDLRDDLNGCSWLLRLLPELAERNLLQLPAWPLLPEQERRLMFAAVARFLANVAGPSGTLLVLDDLHWAGADACDLLTSLVNATAAATQSPLRIVGGYRDTEDGSPLAATIGDLTRARLLHQATLGRLRDDEAAALLQAALLDASKTDPSTLRHVLRQSGGIPFYLVSWAQALRSGTLDTGAGGTLPDDVLQSIRLRVAALPEAAREPLHVLAVAGGKASLVLLRDVLGAGGRNEDELVAGLEAAYRARLLDEEGDDGYQFAQDPIREVVARDLSAARRAALHRRIAEALARMPGERPAEELAFHYLRGGEPVKALEYLERAGDRAVAMQAYAAAEAAYRELVERLDRLGSPLEAAQARQKWGAALCMLARYDEGIAAFEQAISEYRQAGDAEAQARALVQIGQAHADRGTARQGLERLGPLRNANEHVAQQTLAALEDTYAQLLHIAGRYSEQLEEAERAAAHAQASGGDLLLCQIQMRRGSALRMLGRMREASEVLEGVIHVATAIGDPRAESYALENVSIVYLLQGDFARSTRYAERALALTEQLGDPRDAEQLYLSHGMSTCAIGDWQQAQTDFEHARALTRQLGVSWAAAYTALGLGQLRLIQGDMASATDLLGEAISLAEQAGDLQALRWAQTTLAERDLLAEKPAAARDRLEPLLDRPGQQEGLVTYLMPYLAWAALDLGNDARADDLLTQCEARAADEQIRLAHVDALRVRVLQGIRRGAYDEAERTLEVALQMSRDMPYPHAEAKLLYTAGLLAQAQTQPEHARTRLVEARALLQRLGEGFYLPHVERALGNL